MSNLEDLRRSLVRRLLHECGLLDETRESFLLGAKFLTQDDGEMGSFSVINGTRRVGIKDCAEAKYVDDDGIEVVIALIVDVDNNPTDVDFWKVDSSPLVKFPEVGQLAVSKLVR